MLAIVYDGDEDEIAAHLAEHEGMTGDAARSLARSVLEPGKPQLSAVCGVYRAYIREVATKCADLGKRAARDFSRPVITDPRRRAQKYAAETGYDIRAGRFLRAPLEPWTCDAPAEAMRLYGEIMAAPDGTRTAADYPAPRQRYHLAWMQAEQLITTGPGGSIHALGDRTARQPAYPGAPRPDRPYGGGGPRQLRDLGRGLVLAAYWNITCGQPLVTVRRAGMLRSGGVALSASAVCAEVNAIKARRRDLDGYRYMSTETCRRILAGLLRSGDLSEVEPPSRIRAGRTWVTLPRVYELPAGAAEFPPARPPGRRRRRRSLSAAAFAEAA
jgi:hypothetical protein